MAALIHPIDSFWLLDMDYAVEEDVVVIDVIDRPNAGPADSRQLKLPTNGYNAQMLYRIEQETGSHFAHAVILKPTTVGQTILVFGSIAVLDQFADYFFPF